MNSEMMQTIVLNHTNKA